MFGKPGKSKKTSPRSGTALDRRQQALREKEESIRLHQQKLERLILEAPRIKEAQDRRMREERAQDPRLSHTVLVDKHAYHVSTMANPGFGSRPLRSEKRDGLYLFLFLVAVLASIVFWIFRLVL